MPTRSIWIHKAGPGWKLCDAEAPAGTWEGYFYLDGEEWVLYLSQGEYPYLAGTSLAFTRKGEAWLCYDGVLVQTKNGVDEPVATLDECQSCPP